MHCKKCGQLLVAEWTHNIPLINNRFMLKDMAVVYGISIVIMELLVAGMSFFLGEEVVWIPLPIVGIVIGILIVLFLIAAGVVLRNRISMQFTLSPEGITWDMGSRQKRINRVGMILAMLVGRPGAAGASMLAVSGETGGIPWRNIHKITTFPSLRVITLSNSWRPVLRLHVPDHLWATAEAMIRTYWTPPVAEQPTPAQKRESGRALIFRILWAVAAVAACLLATVWYDFDLDDLWRPLFLAGLLVVVASLLVGAARRILAFLGGLLTVYLLVRHMLEGFRPIIGLSGTYYGRSFAADPWIFALSVLGYLTLFALAIRGMVSGRPAAR
ncbi:MAG: hypothetical protein GX604_10450 [Actinobacteria bacterium]|nr:hypothetical protein [Actinomycetota bacterium]